MSNATDRPPCPRSSRKRYRSFVSAGEPNPANCRIVHRRPAVHRRVDAARERMLARRPELRLGVEARRGPPPCRAASGVRPTASGPRPVAVRSSPGSAFTLVDHPCPSPSSGRSRRDRPRVRRPRIAAARYGSIRRVADPRREAPSSDRAAAALAPEPLGARPSTSRRSRSGACAAEAARGDQMLAVTPIASHSSSMPSPGAAASARRVASIASSGPSAASAEVSGDVVRPLAVGLVHDEHVGDLQDAGLRHLHRVAPARRHDHQGRVGRRGDVHLGLSHAHGLDDRPGRGRRRRGPERPRVPRAPSRRGDRAWPSTG